MGLRDKRAILPGGTRGTGCAIADTLAAEGASVGIRARNADQVTKQVAALKDKGVGVTGASVDMSHGKARCAWVHNAGNELGGIDILVSNAGARA